MPYLYKECEGEEARDQAKEIPPFGPGFGDEETRDVVRLEVWASSFNDPGEDFTDWKLFDAQGRLVTERRIPGY
jgi:hypothetical protein